MSYSRKLKRINRTSVLLSIVAVILLILTIFALFSDIIDLSKKKETDIIDGGVHEINGRDLFEDGIKYMEIANGYVIDELILETGSALPSIRDYFNLGYEGLDNVTIHYYDIGHNELTLDDFTVKINDTFFVKGIKDIYVQINENDKEYMATLRIKDTTTPEIDIKTLIIYEGETVFPNDFVVRYLDNSFDDNYTVEILNKEDYSKAGIYKVKLKICDNSLNCVNAETKVIVREKIEVADENSETKSITETIQVTKRKQNENVTNSLEDSNNTSNNSNSSSDESYQQKDFQSNDINTEVTNNTKSDNPYFWDMVSDAEKYFSDEFYQEPINYTRNAFITKSNEARRKVGVPDLVLDPTICLLAEIRVLEYESLGWSEAVEYIHKRPDGRDFSTIFSDYGYVAGIYNNQRHYGENYVSVTGGMYYNNEGAFTLLYESPAHYANIVAPYYSRMGVANGFDKKTGKLVWIQLFSS